MTPNQVYSLHSRQNASDLFYRNHIIPKRNVPKDTDAKIRNIVPAASDLSQ
jgi:hypothetical protein